MSTIKAQRTFWALALLSFVLLAGAPGAKAATIRVPADHKTIQSAIVAAHNGDTVLVSPGTYAENIDFLDKGITVASSEGPEKTIIDAKGKGTVVSIDGLGGYERKCSLTGFTLRNGGAS